MLTIKLQRIGKSKEAMYRLVICEKAQDPWGKHLELLGTFNPHKKDGFNPNVERVKYWISKGAQATNTVHNLLILAGIISDKKRKSVCISRDRAKKIEEKKKAAA
jgi:small subunit ribosomal protein S16